MGIISGMLIDFGVILFLRGFFFILLFEFVTVDKENRDGT